MSGAVDALLALGVACAWLGALAMVRLPPLGRPHAVSFVSVAAGGAVTLATWFSEGATPRTGKVLLIWVVLVLGGALSSHVMGRAIYLRGGDRP